MRRSVLLLGAALLGTAALTTACAESDSGGAGRQQAQADQSSPQADRAGHLPAFTGLVEANRDAVVNISTTRTVGGGQRKVPERFEGTPFEPFFKRFFQGPHGGERKVRSLGSGFIVSSQGHIVTNAHVVKKASQVVVQLADRRQLEAEVVGKDMATDLALLKVDAEGLPTVRWSQGPTPAVGEWVLAMGSPFGFEQSVTAGIVSAKGRSISGKAGSYVPFLQTDVAINPGSSGGPLFNQQGEVIGVNSQIYSKSGGYMGLSFAVPSGVAQEVVADLRDDGEVAHGYLGVRMQDLNSELAQSMGLDKPRGGLIADVLPGTPAEKAGLKAGDIILEVAGQPVTEAGDVPPVVGGHNPGEEIPLVVLRDGERVQKTVTLGSLDEARSEEPSEAEPASALGLRLVPVPDALRRQRPLPDSGGALVKALGEGPGRQSGLRPGDVILKLADARVQGPHHLARLVKEVDGPARVPVLVQRQEQTLFLPVQIP